MYKVDLHTHSIDSKDGGTTARQYQHALASGLLDCVAVTDHNSIDFATRLQADLGNVIIVGEEIMTNAGEIIGLYLKEAIPAGLSVSETIQRIKAQGGIVYVPHPFETVRKGLPPDVLDELTDQIDIVEIYNGRAFAQDKSKQTVVWARLNQIPGAASSDAHGHKALGKTYTDCKELPAHDTLAELIKSATPIAGRPSIRDLLYPKFHTAKNKITGAS